MPPSVLAEEKYSRRLRHARDRRVEPPTPPVSTDVPLPRSSIVLSSLVPSSSSVLLLFLHCPVPLPCLHRPQFFSRSSFILFSRSFSVLNSSPSWIWLEKISSAACNCYERDGLRAVSILFSSRCLSSFTSVYLPPPLSLSLSLRLPISLSFRFYFILVDLSGVTLCSQWYANTPRRLFETCFVMLSSKRRKWSIEVLRNAHCSNHSLSCANNARVSPLFSLVQIMYGFVADSQMHKFRPPCQRFVSVFSSLPFLSRENGAGLESEFV